MAVTGNKVKMEENDWERNIADNNRNNIYNLSWEQRDCCFFILSLFSLNFSVSFGSVGIKEHLPVSFSEMVEFVTSSSKMQHKQMAFNDD